jgi:hypothetical protein
MDTLAALHTDYFAYLGRGLAAIVLYAIVGLVLMIIGFFAVDLSTACDLRKLVRDGRPNAVLVTAVGTVAMALIVVLAIYASGGDSLWQGLITALAFGLIGIVAQVAGVRMLESLVGLDIGGLLAAEDARPQAWVVAAAHLALGLVVSVAIL